MAEERICKGTPSGVRFGAALNSIFSTSFALGVADSLGLTLEDLFVQGDDLMIANLQIL